MIDLHTHTDESDGSLTPEQLLDAARAAGLRTLAITDHDTFAGYDKAAASLNGDPSLRLLRGIELNTRHANRSVHLLAYFVHAEPTPAFREWLGHLVDNRRQRNLHLIDKLRSLGVEIEMKEVEALGRTLTGRPHFARILVNKGYAKNRDEAFSDFLGETGRAFVERDSPTLAETIAIVSAAGGLSSLAHPIRLGKPDPVEEEKLIAEMCGFGLPAIEAFHTDHTAADTDRYRALAGKYALAITGGSDFHGSYKPGVRLGYVSNGTLPIPDSVLTALDRHLFA